MNLGHVSKHPMLQISHLWNEIRAVSDLNELIDVGILSKSLALGKSLVLITTTVAQTNFFPQFNHGRNTVT